MPTSLTLHIYGATNNTVQTTAERHKQEKRSAFKSNTSKSLMINLECFSLIPAFSFVKLTKFFSISVKGFWRTYILKASCTRTNHSRFIVS